MRVQRMIIALLAVVGSVAVHGTADADEPSTTGDPQHAWFEGGTIDLSQSWGAATACVELGDHTECFRTEAEMIDAHPELGESPPSAKGRRTSSEAGASLLAVDCSTSLRLYANTNFGGGVIYITTRGVWINLSSVGFDNMTSSYKVGACSAVFRSNAGGGGSTYPGTTAPGVQVGAMYSGWDNVVSSVLIN